MQLPCFEMFVFLKSENNEMIMMKEHFELAYEI